MTCQLCGGFVIRARWVGDMLFHRRCADEALAIIRECLEEWSGRRERGRIEVADERDSALSPESNIMRTAPADPAISGEAGACAFIGDRR